METKILMEAKKSQNLTSAPDLKNKTEVAAVFSHQTANSDQKKGLIFSERLTEGNRHLSMNWSGLIGQGFAVIDFG